MSQIEARARYERLLRNGARQFLRAAGQEIVERHPKAVQRPADEVVLPDREDDVHHLLRGKLASQRLPRLVRNDGALVQIVRCQTWKTLAGKLSTQQMM